MNNINLLHLSPIPMNMSFWAMVLVGNFVFWLKYSTWWVLLKVFIILGLIFLLTLKWSHRVNFENIILAKSGDNILTSFIKLAMVMFITSEVMLFGTAISSFLYSVMFTPMLMTTMWPGSGLLLFDPKFIPLFGTALLFMSSITLTIYHHNMFITTNHFDDNLMWMWSTIMMGSLFFIMQLIEFFTSPFSFNDSIYGSMFFFITGLHGSHVLIGLIILSYSTFFYILGYKPTVDSTSTDCAAWYWHFVDVVWFFVVSLIYCYVFYM